MLNLRSEVLKPHELHNLTHNVVYSLSATISNLGTHKDRVALELSNRQKEGRILSNRFHQLGDDLFSVDDTAMVHHNKLRRARCASRNDCSLESSNESAASNWDFHKNWC